MRICPRRSASRFDSGSSMRKACGWRMIARASATRWRWPPESWRGMRLEQVIDLEQLCDPLDLVGALGLGDPAHAQRVADVVADGLVRIQRVALEDHRDVTVLRLEHGDVTLADEDAPLGRRLEAGEHAQRGGLAAARRAEHGQERRVGHDEVQRLERLGGAEALGDALVADLHRLSTGPSRRLLQRRERRPQPLRRGLDPRLGAQARVLVLDRDCAVVASGSQRAE